MNIFHFLIVSKHLLYLYNSIYTICSKAAYQSVDIVLCVFSFFWPSIKMKACNNVYTIIIIKLNILLEIRDAKYYYINIFLKDCLNIL